jgi:hypothetical protein
MDTLREMADRSPIDTIAGHLDSRIDTLHEEMLAALANLKELKAHDFQKVADAQAALRQEIAAAALTSRDRENALRGETFMALANLKELKAHDFQKVADAQTALREEIADATHATRDRQDALRNEMVNLFAAQDKAIMAAMAAAERAVGKSEIATEKRFDAVNEFRAQLSDQAATFLPRAEFDRVTTAITEKIDASNKTFSERLDDLRASRDTTSGKSAGMNAGWALLIGLAGVIATVLTIAAFFRR